jgi:hypothetical protein
MILAICNHLSLKFLGTGNKLWFNRQMSKISCHEKLSHLETILYVFAFSINSTCSLISKFKDKVYYTAQGATAICNHSEF